MQLLYREAASVLGGESPVSSPHSPAPNSKPPSEGGAALQGERTGRGLWDETKMAQILLSFGATPGSALAVLRGYFRNYSCQARGTIWDTLSTVLSLWPAGWLFAVIVMLELRVPHTSSLYWIFRGISGLGKTGDAETGGQPHRLAACSHKQYRLLSTHPCSPLSRKGGLLR